MLMMVDTTSQEQYTRINCMHGCAHEYNGEGRATGTVLTHSGKATSSWMCGE
jgi:hypothetical protein